MPKPSKVLCHVSQSHLVKPCGSPYVWISDEVLAQTFNSFSRCHKRHGSHVPGPLEAQRRATRRRTTNVAYTSPYNPGYQPFEIFGAKPKDGWWDKQLLQAKALTLSSSWLWSFLSPQVSPSTDQPPPPPDLNIHGIEDEKGRVKSVKRMKEKILDRLKQIHTHSALMTLLRVMSINLTQDPQLTQVILEHILEQNWQLDQLEEFLLEPQTNPPGSANLFYLLKNSEQHPSIVEELVQRKVFVRAVLLGLIDVESLKKILMLVIRSELSSGLSEQTFPWATFSMDLLLALDCSKVICLGDLGQSFIIEWLRLIKSREFQPAKAQLLWILYTSLGHFGRKALRKVVLNSIRTMDRTCLNYMPALANFVLSQPQGQLRDILLPVTQDLLSEAAAKCDVPTNGRDHDENEAAYLRALTLNALEYQKQMQSIDNSIVQADRNSENEKSMFVNRTDTNKCGLEIALSNLSRQPSDLEKWYIFLRILNVPALTSFRLSSGFFKAYLNDTHLGMEEQRLFVIQFWISMAVFDHCRMNLEEFTKRKISSLFSRLFSLYTGVEGEDKLVNFIRITRSLPLPAKPQLLRYASFVCKDLSYNGQTYEMLVEKVDDLDRGQVVNVSKTRYFNSARASYPALLSEVAESMNEDMRRFENTCRSLIRETEKGPVLVYRLLTQNHELKFALRQAAILSFSSSLRWENKDAAQKTALGNYSFNQVVDMINNFAAECVNNHHMSARNCFRKVFWYYKFLHRCRAPIRPALLDTLWIASVERYHGSSKTEVLSWLYKISVAYLGQQKAKACLQRAMFKDRSLQPIAASITRREGKKQSYEAMAQTGRPLKLVWTSGEQEDWSEDLKPSIFHSKGANDAEHIHHSGAFNDADLKTYLPQDREQKGQQFSQSMIEKHIDTKSVLPQIDALCYTQQTLRKLGKTTETVEQNSRSKIISEEGGTVTDLATSKHFELNAVPIRGNAVSAGTVPQFNPGPNIAEFEASFHTDDSSRAETKAASQIPQQVGDGSKTAQFEGSKLMTNELEIEEGADLPEGTAMDAWLGTQYTTLEARMISVRKGKIKKPGRRRSKTLRWI